MWAKREEQKNFLSLHADNTYDINQPMEIFPVTLFLGACMIYFLSN